MNTEYRLLDLVYMPFMDTRNRKIIGRVVAKKETAEGTKYAVQYFIEGSRLVRMMWVFPDEVEKCQD